MVERGRWEVCSDARFGGRCTVLQRGSYDSMRALGLHNEISSARPVTNNRRYDNEAPAPLAAPNYEYRQRYRALVVTPEPPPPPEPLPCAAAPPPGPLLHLRVSAMPLPTSCAPPAKHHRLASCPCDARCHLTSARGEPDRTRLPPSATGCGRHRRRRRWQQLRKSLTGACFWLGLGPPRPLARERPGRKGFACTSPSQHDLHFHNQFADTVRASPVAIAGLMGRAKRAGPKHAFFGPARTRHVTT